MSSHHGSNAALSHHGSNAAIPKKLKIPEKEASDGHLKDSPLELRKELAKGCFVEEKKAQGQFV